jgi:hypothetical protein
VPLLVLVLAPAAVVLWPGLVPVPVLVPALAPYQL